MASGRRYRRSRGSRWRSGGLSARVQISLSKGNQEGKRWGFFKREDWIRLEDQRKIIPCICWIRVMIVMND